jgi:hypothetical protein
VVGNYILKPWVLCSVPYTRWYFYYFCECFYIFFFLKEAAHAGQECKHEWKRRRECEREHKKRDRKEGAGRGQLGKKLESAHYRPTRDTSK